MHSFRNIPFSFIVLMTVLISACNNNTENPPSKKSITIPTNAGFEYRFGDASKPPPYHRSYSISIQPGIVRLEITSYGDVLLKDSSILSTAQYNDFAAKVSALHIRVRVEKPKDDCVGGSTDYLDLYTGTPELVSGYISHCGNADTGTLDGDVEKCIYLFHDMVPDLGKKIEATRNN